MSTARELFELFMAGNPPSTASNRPPPPTGGSSPAAASPTTSLPCSSAGPAPVEDLKPSSAAEEDLLRDLSSRLVREVDLDTAFAGLSLVEIIDAARLDALKNLSFSAEGYRLPSAEDISDARHRVALEAEAFIKQVWRHEQGGPQYVQALWEAELAHGAAFDGDKDKMKSAAGM